MLNSYAILKLSVRSNFNIKGKLMKILVVEDDKKIVDMLKLFFQKEKWQVECIENGEDAIRIVKSKPNEFDLMTLDLNLPGVDGIQVAKEVRGITQLPIIMITARETESEQVMGFETGADEYITKPFSAVTLVSRIKSLMNRINVNTNPAEPEPISANDVQNDLLSITTSSREVIFGGTPITDLTPKEFDLLKLLASYPKKVFSREALVENVWGYSSFGDERTVDAHVKKLRQKLGELGPEVINTVWGVGYKYDDTTVVVNSKD